MTLQGQDFIVLMNEAEIGRVSEIAEALGSDGVRIRSVMEDTGVIFAVMDERRAASVRTMAGVLAVEPGGKLHILA